jgi:translocation and assembly module TamB
VYDLVAELDGRVDANVRLHVSPGKNDDRADGAIIIRDGAFLSPVIGERFHAAEGRVSMPHWGTLRIEDVSAPAPGGRLSASAEVTLEGLTPRSVVARLHVAAGESIAIAPEGVPLGRVHGDVRLRAHMAENAQRLDAVVDVPSLHVELPRTPRHALQRLEPDETIRVGVGAGEEFVTLALGPAPKPRAPSAPAIRATVELGGDVEIRRGTALDLVLEGSPTVEITDRLHVFGQLHVVRGTLDVQGKQFSVDRAVVTFTDGDADDPMVVATASWIAPDQTRVYADFSGRLQSGRVVLRSTPPLTDNELLALLLFGTREGTSGAETTALLESAALNRAASLAGGLVTEALNRAIAGVTTARITTRIDTSQAGTLRPEVSIQLSRSLSARLRYTLGVPAPGQRPDRTELILSLRFFRNWSLDATIGDQGSTSLDATWRLQY